MLKMEVSIKNNFFDYDIPFTTKPYTGVFSYSININYCLPNQKDILKCDLQYFKTPQLFPKLLYFCLVKQLDIYTGNNKLQQEFAIFATHFDTFNPIIKDREYLIFISLLLTLQDFELAKTAYFQTKKRCVVRDFWQCIVHEESDAFGGALDAEEQEPVEIKSLISLDCIDCIFPYFFRNLEDHPLVDYGFDPTDGIWKPLNYHKLECQEGDIIQNYNFDTAMLVKISPELDLWKYLIKTHELLIINNLCKLARDSSACIYLAALPLELSFVLLVTIRHIYNFVYGPRDIITGYNYVVTSNAITTELLLKIIAHEDTKQKETLINFLDIFKPALEKRFGTIIPDIE
jgi:hypothetical protein